MQRAPNLVVNWLCEKKGELEVNASDAMQRMSETETLRYQDIKKLRTELKYLTDVMVACAKFTSG